MNNQSKMENKMNRRSLAIAGVGALAMVGLAACGTDGDNDFGWVGTTYHFEMEGFLDDETLDFSLDSTQASNQATLTCTREYEVPVINGTPDYSQAVFVEVKLNALVDLGSGARIAELEFKQHDMSADAIGDQVTIAPRIDGVATADNEMWFEWEWHTLDDQDLYESAARQGSFTLHHFSGTADSNGIIPDGTGEVGGVIHAFWSANEEVSVSFTVACGDNKISEVE